MLVNGTFYEDHTPTEIVKILEKCRIDGTRILLDYGDIETGTSWGETCDVTGYVGRSTGTKKNTIDSL